MALIGEQIERLNEALLDAYRRRPDLSRMIKFKLNRNLENMTGPGGLEDVMFELVDRAEAEGWVEELVAAAVQDRGGNPRLREFYDRNWLALSVPSRTSLESLVKPKNRSFDYEPWVRRLIEIGPRVCHVAVNAEPESVYGTGFLVGPDLLLTNYHVMEAAILGEDGRATSDGRRAKGADAVFLFDFKRMPDGKTLNRGTPHRLAGSGPRDWLVHASLASQLDDRPVPGAVPAPDELDFTLLRLAGSPGAARGWVDLPTTPPGLTPGASLFILQHPQGKALKLAIETDSVIGLNANRTRVLYMTSTEPGSSGSPCFDSNWNLAAIHHRGDPNFGHTSNQGIPIEAIDNLLEERNLRARLRPFGGSA
jgi:hypothetical protein